MLNSGRRGRRAQDGYGVISVNENFNQQSYPIPTINSYAVTDESYNPSDDLALNTAGGQTVVIYGSGFRAGVVVNINGSNITTTLLDQGRLAITSPALSSGSYTIYASNTNGATAMYVPGLIYSGTPTWSTATDLGIKYETKSYSQNLVATSDSTVTYSLAAGSTLPDGITLNSSTGELSGTLPAESGSTAYAFTIIASDAELQDTTRQFSLTINTDVVTWATPSANYVISSYEYAPIANVTANATSAAGYSVMYAANTLPTGITLDTTSGLISGTIETVGNTDTRLTATANTTNRSATRDVLFNVNQDVVTWSNPASDTIYTLPQGTAISPVVLSAASASGFGVQYTANALPTGVSLSGGTISGTPTQTETVYTALTATANTTSRTAVRYVTWTVSIASDTYWKNNTLLLSADSSSQINSFVADNSINNAQQTVFGDTGATNFNPYQQGYYGVEYTGTVNSFISIPHNSKLSIMSGDTNTFVAECFVYWNVVVANSTIFDKSGRNTVSFQNWAVELDASKQFRLAWGASGTPGTSGIGILNTTTIPVAGKWYHIAFVKSNSNWALFIDGTRITNYTGLNTANDANPGALRVGFGIQGEANSGYMNGHISNVRVYNGPAIGAPYSATSTTITVPTSPFGDGPNIYAITNQSARYIDNSSTAATITAGSTTKISSVHPFSTVYQAGTPYYSTYFDGTGDYLSLSGTMSAIGTNDFTVEMWIRVTTSGTYNVLDFTPAGSNGAYLNFYLNSMTPMLYVNSANRITGSGALNINQWYHVAISRLSGNTRMFIDGTQSGSTWTDSTSYLSPANRPVLCTSGNSIGANYMPGIISNLRIINGTGYSSITPSTSPLTAVAGTSLLTCQDSTFKDNSTNAYTITPSGDAKPVAVSPFTPSSYTSTEITTYGSGYFDGTGDYLTVPASINNALGTDFTVECWIYQTGTQTTTYGWGIVGTYDGGSNGGWSITINRTTGSYGIGFVHGNAWQATYNTYLPTNTWHHIAVTRSGSSLRIFLNGTQVALNSNYSTSDTVNAVNYIGSQGTGQLFTGYISNVRIVKGTALYTSNFLPQFTSPPTNVTNTQLLTLQTNGSHNNSTFKDSSSFNNVITRPTGTNATNGTFSPYGDNWSVYVDTGNPVMYTGNSTELAMGTSNFTIEAWINLSVVPNASQAFYIFSNRYANGVSGDGPMACVTNSKLYARDGNSGYITGTTTFVANRWYHVAVVRSGTSIYCFVDGVQEGTTYTTSSSYTGNSIRVGYEAQFGLTNTAGYVSNLRAIKGTALYTSTFTPPTAPLTAITNTRALLCNNNRHMDGSILNSAMTTSASITVQKFSPFSTVTVPKYYSVQMNGSGNYVSVPGGNSGFAFGTGDLTIEGWVYSLSGTQFTLFDNRSTSTSVNIAILLNSTTISVYIGGSSFVINGTTFAINTWYHIAVVRISGVMKLYINGTQQGISYNSSQNFTSVSSPVCIGGGYPSGTNVPLNGYVSNVRVVKGLGVYTGNFTVPTSPLTATQDASANISAITAGQTVLLTCQDNKSIDKSASSQNVTVNGTARPVIVSPFTPTANSITTYNTTTFGGSIYFDGTGDYLQTATGLIHTDITQTDYTVECWVYNQGAGAERYIFSQRGSSSGWEMRINATNTVSFFFTGGTTFTSATTIKASEWTHIAVVRTGTAMSMYINGVKDSTGSGTQTNGTSAYTSYGLWLGNSTSAGGGLMLGYISDAKVTKGVALYTGNFYPGTSPATPTTSIGVNTHTSTYLLSGTSGGVIDATRTVDLETVADAKVTNFSPYNGSYYSVNFTGASTSAHNIVNPGAPLSLDGDFTVEFWVNMRTYGASSAFTYNHFLSMGLNSSAFKSSSGAPYFYNGTSYSYTGVTIPLNRWTHVVWIRSGSSSRVYVNGVGSTTLSTLTTTISWDTGTFRIANDGGGNNETLNGFISNVRIVKGTALYDVTQSTITVPTDKLTAVSGTSLLTCQDNKFKDNSTNNYTITNTAVSVATQNPFQVNSGKSYYFDGTGDYMTVSTGTGTINFGTADFTIETWVYFEANNGTYNPFIRVNGGAQLDFGFDFSVNQLKYNTSAAVLANSWTPKVGEWYHIALVRSAGVAKIYVNGTNISSSGAVDSFNHSLNSATTYYRIGGSDFNSAHVMRGYLTDLRITKGVARTISVPSSPVIAK